jgi:hypothetical protein
VAAFGIKTRKPNLKGFSYVSAATSTSRYYSKDFFIATTFLKTSRIAVAPKTASCTSHKPTVLVDCVS